jgi:8-oxo-dGTP diphosphatase
MNLPFNVRIYGVLIENGAVLVSDEYHFGQQITKFPGGGLQFGEGTIEGLKREFMEELQLDIKVLSHFYTVDFFQPSAFNHKHQVISIYYLIEKTAPIRTTVSFSKQAEVEKVNGSQSFRWIAREDLGQDAFTFPIDKRVAEMLLEFFQGT